MNFRVPVTIALIALPALALADWTGSGMVNHVYSHDGYHMIYTTIASSVCGDSGEFWWPTSDPDAKDMFAIAMTALVTEKQISVVQDPGAPSCLFGAQRATHMVISR